jgi:hypothetical protein
VKPCLVLITVAACGAPRGAERPAPVPPPTPDAAPAVTGPPRCPAAVPGATSARCEVERRGARYRLDARRVADGDAWVLELALAVTAVDGAAHGFHHEQMFTSGGHGYLPGPGQAWGAGGGPDLTGAPTLCVQPGDTAPLPTPDWRRYPVEREQRFEVELGIVSGGCDDARFNHFILEARLDWTTGEEPTVSIRTPEQACEEDYAAIEPGRELVECDQHRWMPYFERPEP